MRSGLVMVVIGGCFLALGQPALAGNDIYFVTYNHHIEQGETELMVMTDYTEPAERSEDEKLGGYLSNMIELEYGVRRPRSQDAVQDGGERPDGRQR